MHLQIVLGLLRQHQLVAKRSKCQFCQTADDYLGYVISKHGLRVGPIMISAIREWPPPRNVKQVRSFLWFAGYYRRFIHHYAVIAGPLTDLLSFIPFAWTDATQVAFDTLKEKLSDVPVLALSNLTGEFQLVTDASGKGIGAVLSQKRHPRAYFIQKICNKMHKASTYHQVMFVITQAISKWRQYLLGRRYTIYTEQKSLKSLKNQTIHTPEQQILLSKLVGFEFKFMYRPGKLNKVADSLSRIPKAVFSQFQYGVTT